MRKIFPLTFNILHGSFPVFICLIFVFSIGTSAFSQRFNNWHFPRDNGLTFNSGSPLVITNSAIGSNYFSCASISDTRGNLLFYSNGVNVWNKDNQLMPNGFGLKGEYCQINGLMIIPFLNDTSKYYVFTSQGLTFGTGRPDTLRYSYSIIDMKLNGGLGDVVSKNSAIRGYAVEKMVAVPHSNGSDIWWICRDRTNNFYSYKINCLGFQNNNPVISTIGNNVELNGNSLTGDIKASPDGNYIASCHFDTWLQPGYFELYNFNKTTGVLSSAINIPATQAYGVEFSPNSKVLYVTQRFVINNVSFPTVTQYSLANYDSAAISNSLYKVFETGIECGLQLGPDNKLYHAGGRSEPVVDVINYPDVLGASCNFQPAVLTMPNSGVRRFPYSYVNFITNQNVQIPTYTVAADCRTVSFTGKTFIKGTNLTFKWMYGDGDSTIQIVPTGGDTTFTTVTHTFPTGIDAYNVQLFVTSDTVCGQGSAGKQITLKPPRPKANFGVNLQCNNLAVNFTDSSRANGNPSLSYNWQFISKVGNLLGSSTTASSSFTFPAFDTVKVRLIVTSSLACVPADTLEKIVVLKAKPTAAFSSANSCGSLAASFTNTSTVAADTLTRWFWLLGDGNTSTLRNPLHTYPGFANYTARLVVQSALGCLSDTTQLTVQVKAKPVANFIYNNNGCAGAPVTLQDSSYLLNGTLTNYYWQLPSGTSVSNGNLTTVFTATGSQPIGLTVTGSNGCSSDTLFKNVFIEANPVAGIAPVTGSCTGTPVRFTNIDSIAAGNIAQYKWWFSAADSSSLANPLFTFGTAGNYNILHQAISANGCRSNVAAATITIEQTPQAAFTVSPACVGRPVTFTNTSSMGSAITQASWQVNGSSVSNNANAYTYNFYQAGSYPVGFTIATANGCSSSTTLLVRVEAAAAFAGNDTTVVAGEPFMLNGSGGTIYLWHPPTGLSSTTIARPIALLQNSQQYLLRVTTADGCTGEDSVYIKLLRLLNIPNAFSPNNDGINDTWQIPQLKDYPKATIQVYNRYGQLVYNGTSQSPPWNGYFNSKPLPKGTYYYLINLHTPQKLQPYAGSVTVF